MAFITRNLINMQRCRQLSVTYLKCVTSMYCNPLHDKQSSSVMTHAVNQHPKKYYSTDTPPYWDYTRDFGPSKWAENWKVGERQSPIDILTKLAVHDPSLKPYVIDDTPVSLNLKNFGLNVTTTPTSETEILLQGGALSDHVYQFREFHFHWGNVNSCGCEHTLNGHRFAAELHIVHWNRNLFSTETAAISGSDGLAVLGVFLEAKDNYEDNAALTKLLEMFQKVPYKDDSFNAPSTFTPYSLLPANKQEYFTYLGSLTTPPLTENVTWTVFRKPLKISTKQLNMFNALYAVTEEEKNQKHTKDFFVRESNDIPQPPTITNNYRPTQPLHSRVVRSSFKINN